MLPRPMLAAAFYEDPLTLFAIGIILVILFFWYFATDIERRKRNVGTALLVGVAALCFVSIFPPKERLKGGIDIVGGSSFTLRVQPRTGEDGNTEAVTHQQVDQAIKVIEGRLNSMGTTEPLIARQGDDRVLVQMPGVDPEESERIRTILEKVAKLELREVHRETDQPTPGGKTLAKQVADGEEFRPGYKAFQLKDKDAQNNEVSRPILLSRRVALGGSDVKNASPSVSKPDAVSILLNSKGGDKMIALTEKMEAGRDRIAIVLDGEVLSAPVVQSVPLGTQFEITGIDKPGEVQNLANALMNPLENPLVVEEQRTVSPLLGAAIVQQGIWSGILGLGLTFVFVLVYYRTAGLVALVGLLLNCLMLFGVMAMFGFTFSLPGIAGIILTIGVAVDANVLINERLREELAAGKSLKVALSASYDKAFSAIFDSNLTSLITAVILFWLGSSTVKGFAVTLTIGILCSMFSAILATRVLFRWGTDLGILKNLTFLNLISSKNYDFLGKRAVCLLISLGLSIVAVGAFVVKQERSLGIDFTGGTRLQFLVGKTSEISAADAQKKVDSLALNKAAFVQDESNPTSGHLLSVRCDPRDVAVIEAKLRESYPVLAEKTSEGTYKIDANKEEVSALVGGGFLASSLLALGLGILGIFIYVSARFEFSFAVGAFIALLHDCLISAGFIVLFGRELSLIHVGAILTIAGYSINDTIIIFDRIRESLQLRRGGHTLQEVMNEAINATLSRTVLTSTATLVCVLSLAVLGGAALRDFSIVILIGIFIGTYSSIFVAAPIVLWWANRGKGRIGHTEAEQVSPHAKAIS
jgi:SecD/SecF fusion protein